MKDYFLGLERIQSVFQDIMREVITNHCYFEQTELHAICIEQAGCAKHIYFDRENISEEILECEEEPGNRALILRYLRKKFGSHKFILEESEVYRRGEYQYKVFWVLLSECLDSNGRNLVLKYYVRQFAGAFDGFIKSGSNENTGEEDYWKSVSAGVVIEKTENIIKFLLQEMFSPFKVDFVNGLSGEYYEKAECESNIVFLPHKIVDDLSKNDLIYHFRDIEFVSSNIRLLRKLLQVTQKELWLVLGETDNRDTFEVLGICTNSALENIIKDNKNVDIPCIKVRIKKHMQWDMFLNKKYIFTCKNGHYKIEQSLQKEYLEEKITAYFGRQESGYASLIESIIQAQAQEHGTMLVIMDVYNAREEVRRLGSLGYGFMEEVPHVQLEINRLNAIDGSVILDTEGKVHGIGMILDGITLERGELSRGARYNSALKYRSYLRDIGKSKQLKAMFLIRSEDGSVDIIYA